MRLAKGIYCLTVVLAVALAGCATSGGGMSDAEQIDAVLKAWEAAAMAADVDAMMATNSEAFSHDGYDFVAEDKEELREFIEEGIDMGYFEDVEVSFEDAETEMEDDGTAVVYPIDFVNSQGAVTLTVVLTKEKAGWLITDMEIEGL